MENRARWIALLFLAFVLFYASQVTFPGSHCKSYVLTIGLVASVLVSLSLGLGEDEVFVVGLAFAMPMLDQLIYLPTALGRIVEEVILYLAMPAVAISILHRHPGWADVGISLGERRTTFRITLLLVGGAIAMSLAGLLVPSMTEYYPIWRTGTEVGLSDFLYNEMVIGIMMFAGEAFFRGVILFTLGRRSFWGAVVFQSLPYAYLHFGKPGIEVPYSLVAGIIFGWANLKSKSVLPSWVTHFSGSALFDALILLT